MRAGCYQVAVHVDDVLSALGILDPGVGFEEGKLTSFQERVEADLNIPAYERTFKELVKMADSVYEWFKFTTECPSSQQEGKVPVLDLKLYFNEEGVVIHKFYEKPVSCLLVIPEKSAQSKRI